MMKYAKVLSYERSRYRNLTWTTCHTCESRLLLPGHLSTELLTNAANEQEECLPFPCRNLSKNTTVHLPQTSHTPVINYAL